MWSGNGVSRVRNDELTNMLTHLVQVLVLGGAINDGNYSKKALGEECVGRSVRKKLQLLLDL